MTVQKKILDLTGTQYLVQKITGEIPVKISDLQDDVTLGTHIADTDKHVTTADKNKWNNQTYVLRYSSTTLVASSTNSNSLLDNTDNLKIGDKVLDSSGNIYVVTAIDTANSTFTIGTSLIDLAQDSDVVHKSGDEITTGFKQFANIRVNNSIKGINLGDTTTDLDNCYSDFAPYGESKGGNIQYYTCNTDAGTANISNLPEAKAFFLTSITTRLISNSLYVKQILINSNSKTFVRYCANAVWSSWVNVSDSEYVHKSGNETVNGVKTFTDSMQFKSNVAEYGVTAGNIQFSLIDKNGVSLSRITQGVFNNGISYITLQLFGKDSNNQTVTNRLQYQYSSNFDYSYVLPTDNSVWLGSTGNRWGRIYGIQYYYGNDNVEFSNKFVTTDTAQTVSGQKVFDDINAISSSSEIGVSGGNNSFKVLDKNKKTISRLDGGTFSSGMAYSFWLVNNGADAFNGVSLYQASANLIQLRPYSSELSVQLGASSRYFTNCYTSKVNNLEPSSLSLPSGNLNDIIDISSYLTDLTGSTANTYTAPANGWISITMSSSSGIQAYITGLWGHQIVRPTVGGVRFLMPILKDKTANILIFNGTIDNARFIPCQGNV